MCAQDRIEITLTWACDVRCADCSNLCGPVPSDESIGLDRLAGFLRMSADAGRKWKVVRLIGGEPTLHPGIREILEMLAVYKADEDPQAEIVLCTNGYGPRAAEILGSLPPGIAAENSRKNPAFPGAPYHIPVLAAPCDEPALDGIDFRAGCPICEEQGMCLSPRGYYYCNVAAAIDRVAATGLARQALPDAEDLRWRLSHPLCRLCGFFQDRNGLGPKLPAGYVSKTWKRLLRRMESNA